MTDEFDIERLKAKRQHNVQEQNALVRYGILRAALWGRAGDYPAVLKRFFECKGIRPDRDILVEFGEPIPIMQQDVYEGYWVTESGRVFQFEIELDESDQRITALREWKDVTGQLEITAHKRGTGATYWYLCFDVLRELNAPPPDYSLD